MREHCALWFKIDAERFWDPKGQHGPGALVACGRHGIRGLGDAGVQALSDLFRGIGAATTLRPDDHHPGGGDTEEAGQAQYLPPAHVPRLQR
jgi:hypothetical protein